MVDMSIKKGPGTFTGMAFIPPIIAVFNVNLKSDAFYFLSRISGRKNRSLLQETFNLSKFL